METMAHLVAVADIKDLAEIADLLSPAWRSRWHEWAMGLPASLPDCQRLALMQDWFRINMEDESLLADAADSLMRYLEFQVPLCWRPRFLIWALENDKSSLLGAVVDDVVSGRTPDIESVRLLRTITKVWIRSQTSDEVEHQNNVKDDCMLEAVDPLVQPHVPLRHGGSGKGKSSGPSTLMQVPPVDVASAVDEVVTDVLEIRYVPVHSGLDVGEVVPPACFWLEPGGCNEDSTVIEEDFIAEAFLTFEKGRANGTCVEVGTVPADDIGEGGEFLEKIHIPKKSDKYMSTLRVGIARWSRRRHAHLRSGEGDCVGGDIPGEDATVFDSRKSRRRRSQQQPQQHCIVQRGRVEHGSSTSEPDFHDDRYASKCCLSSDSTNRVHEHCDTSYV